MRRQELIHQSKSPVPYHISVRQRQAMNNEASQAVKNIERYYFDISSTVDNACPLKRGRRKS